MKPAYSLVACSVLEISVRAGWFIAWFTSLLSLSIFCSFVPYIIENGVLKSPTVVALAVSVATLLQYGAPRSVWLLAT